MCTKKGIPSDPERRKNQATQAEGSRMGTKMILSDSEERMILGNSSLSNLDSERGRRGVNIRILLMFEVGEYFNLLIGTAQVAETNSVLPM